MPSGTYTEQTDTTTFATNDCFSNGVNVLTSFNQTTGAGVVTYKNASSTCYSLELASLTSATFAVKNGSGSVIATGTTEATGSAITITCSGGSPVRLSASCQNAMLGSPAKCATGTCTL